MDIIDKFCHFFVINDPEKFLSLFSENAVYIDCLYGEFRGLKEIEEFYKRCHKEARGYKFIPNSKIFGEGVVSFEWYFSFISNMPHAMGKKIELTGASFLNLDDKGKIIRYRDYADSIIFLLKGNVPEEKIIKFYKKKYRIK